MVARFLTNILEQYAEQAREAARQTGLNIEVRKARGYIPGRVSVWSYEDRETDHTPFWETYEMLKRKM